MGAGCCESLQSRIGLWYNEIQTRAAGGGRHTEEGNPQAGNFELGSARRYSRAQRLSTGTAGHRVSCSLPPATVPQLSIPPKTPRLIAMVTTRRQNGVKPTASQKVSECKAYELMGASDDEDDGEYEGASTRAQCPV